VQYLGEYRIDDYISFGVQLHRFSSGAVYAPTGNVTYTFYENNSTSGAPTGGNLSQLNSKTGLYTARVQLTSASGFEVGKEYFIHIEATVDSVSAGELFCFRTVGNPKVDLDTVKTQTVTCAAGVTVLASVGTASTSTAQTGDAYAIVNSGTYGNSALKTLIDAVDDYIDSEVAAILADTNELQTDLTNGGRLDLLIDAIKAKTDNLPASPASTTNITAASGVTLAPTTGLGNQTADITGTVTTVTNLTNAPTNGDLTATMKASVTAAVPTTAEIKTAMEAAGGHLALILEDTGTTLEGKIDTIDGIVDAILVDTGTTLDTKIEQIARAVVYKWIITIATGNLDMFDSGGSPLGSVTAAFTEDATTVTRKLLVPT
jgi:hypothetical protein